MGRILGERLLSVASSFLFKRKFVPFNTLKYYCFESQDTDIMDLKSVNKKLQSIAPTSLKASWDNVGMLVEPTPPLKVETIFLTNDLTEPVMDEALQKKANLILAYHPPLFVPFKTLTQKTWKERIIIRCLENRVAVYSPHTTYDCVKDGLSDWLISPFAGRSEPLEQATNSSFPSQGKHRAEFMVAPENTDIPEQVKKLNGIEVTVIHKFDESLCLQCCCTDKGLVRLVDLLQPNLEIYSSLQVTPLNKPPMPGHGVGRLCKLEKPTTVREAVNTIKQHLNLSQVRLAKGNGCTEDSCIKSVAVCAGSGGSILRGIEADLYLTGEMSHHEVLDATARGTSVVLCDHSNTERGYLTVLQQKLTQLFDNKINIVVSSVDKDPLDIV